MYSSQPTRRAIIMPFSDSLYIPFHVGTKLSRQLLSEAMNDGYVQSQTCKILLYGAAGTGKSSFMHIILDNPPPEIRRSTSLTARPVTVFQVNTNDMRWIKLSPEERKELLVKAAIGRNRRQAGQERQNSSEENDIVTIVEGVVFPEGSESSGTEFKTSVKESEAEDEVTMHQASPSMSTIPDTKDETPITFSTYEELIKIVDRLSEKGESIATYKKLYLIDSGGQPQFHEMLPAFLRRMTLYVFVFKLSEDLDTKPKVEYFNHSGKSVGTPYQSSHTNQQLLEHCIRVLHTHRASSSNDQVLSSRIMIVGTHRDEEDPETREAKRAEKNEKISELLLNFQEEACFYNVPTNEYIFPVNSLKPEEIDRCVVDEFRRLVLTECIPDPVNVPLRYYALEIILEEYSQRKGRGVLSLDECLEAASELHFEKHTLEAALIFLDELSVVFYFPDVLEGVLFTNPQVLLDKATELVEEVHVLRETKNKVAGVGDMQMFRDYAQVSPRLLSRFQKHYVPGLFTPKELVKLFRKLFVLAELSSGKFFMPALLQVLEEKKVNDYRVSAKSPVAALAVDFPLGGPLLGVYCSLTCFLISNDNTYPCPWKVMRCQMSSIPACLYRNCIRFSIPHHPGCVTLIDTFDHFEVHVSTRKGCVKMCSVVRFAILAGLKKASATLGYRDVAPSLGLLCPCGKKTAHVATFGEDCWICSLNCEEYGGLTHRQRVWKQESSETGENFLFGFIAC